MTPLAELVRRAVVPALALITAFLLGAIVIVLTDVEHLQNLGSDPLGALAGAFGGVLEGYGAMFSGAIGDPGRILDAIRSGDATDIANAVRPISETLVSATPFIFVSLGLVVSFRAGLFNLGADGQFFLGGVGATITVSLLQGQLPPFLALVAGLAGGFVFGAAYGFVPGFLKARSGAHEVITTLMLNSIAPAAATLAFSVVALGASPTPFPRVPVLIDLPTIRVDWGFVAALLTAALVSFLLFRTTIGLELRSTGLKRTVARSGRDQPGPGDDAGHGDIGGTRRARQRVPGARARRAARIRLGSRATSRSPWPCSPACDRVVSWSPRCSTARSPTVPGAWSSRRASRSPCSRSSSPLAVMFVAAPRLIRSIWRLGPARQADLISARPVGPADST